MKSKEFIEDIKNRQINSDKEFILDSLTGAIDRLQKAFPRYESFLMEFLQNADDAESQSLKIKILQNTVIISNDGNTFSEEDIKSICKVGRSSKTPKDYIGYLGVGFKAVFLISDCAEIYSGNYQFKFDKSSWNNIEYIPWQVIPIWIDNPNINLLKNKTVFILSIKTSELIEKIRKEIRPDHLNNRILLFLRNIKRIEIVDVEQNFKREIVKSRCSKTSDYEIYKIQEYENNKLKSQDIWLIFRSICNVPSDVKFDFMTKEWERDTVTKREILVAFKLDNEKNLIIERKGTAHIGVFSFLPLKEIPSGLKFLLQTDFLTAPGRGELARDCLWNNWIADEIYNMIIKKCIPIFLNHKNWKMNFTDILYSEEGGHEIIEEHIKNPLNKYLENEDVLIAEDGSSSKVKELVFLSNEIKELFSDSDLISIFVNKKVLHEDCKPHYNLKTSEPHQSLRNFIFYNDHFEELIKLKAKKREIEWFKKLYAMLVDKYNYNYFRDNFSRYNVAHDNFWDRMHNLNKKVILTGDYNVSKISDGYLNPNKIHVPDKLKGKLRIVHPQIIKDSKFEEFRRKLNDDRYHYSPPDIKFLRELNKEDIKSEISRQETLEMNKEKWENLSDNKRIEKIIEIKKLWQEDFTSLEDYSYITLKSKKSMWVKPENLVFSQEYNPEHNIEILVKKKGILDLKFKFLSPEFINFSNNDEIRIWRRFFEKLGVDKLMESEKKKIVQRIAILTVMKFEKNKNRFPRELGESEKPGYDIESKSESDKKFIEVKGTSKNYYDIFLTVNEFRALRNKKDNYFVYIITDALRTPFLRTVIGAKLLEIPDTKLIIQFSKWKDITESEFQP